MFNYVDKLKHHLAQYKVETLGISEDGRWKRNNRNYAHILPESDFQLNVLDTIRDEFWNQFPQLNIKLHRDFHHLNSSQAMCFNLFYPFMREGGPIDKLLTALELDTGRELEWAFEYEPWIEEKTNFDFYLKLGKTKAYFEIKLSEAEFGTAVGNPRRQTKLKEIYIPRLSNLVDPEALEPTFFFNHYQLMRNISYLAEDASQLFLVFPRENSNLIPKVKEVLELTTPDAVNRIHVTYLEELASKLASSGIDLHARQFAGKYLFNDT